MTNHYELTLLVKENVDEKGREAILDAVRKNLGTLTQEDLWGMKELAYQIMHQRRAYYAHFKFDSEPETIPSLDRMVKLNEDILRYLLVKVTPKKMVKRTSKKAETKTESTEENK